MHGRLSDIAEFVALAASVVRQGDGPPHQIPGYLVPLFIIFGGAVAFTMLWLVGMVTGRLLGLRPPWWRMLIEAYLGGSLGAALASSVGAQQLNSVAAPLVYFGSVLIASMLFMVLFELVALSLSPASDQPRGVGVSNPIRATRRRLARWKRYLQIMGIVTRHGLGQYLSGRRRTPSAAAGETNARRLWARVSQALAEAGGAFVKLGQVLSTRADLLPPEAITELSRLQDNAPPAAPAAIAALLTEELGAPPDEVFAVFEDKPVAAASIAQAHLAEFATGERVIVKVQRPGIREPVERDLDILIRIARMMEARTVWARTFGVVDLAEGFAASLREELDFRVEARNIAAVAASLDDPQRASSANTQEGSNGSNSVATTQVRIPRVFRQHSTDRVLVIELLDGVNVREADPLIERLGLSRAALARTLLRSLLRQILREGTFHADPHPGNVMVLRNGQLALIDFGSVGRLDPLQQAAIKRMLVALDRRNAALLTDALLDLARVRTGFLDEERLERSLAQLMAQRLGAGMDPGPELFVALFALLFDFGLAFPPVIGGVFRALVTVQGTIALLDPDFPTLDEARSIGAEWMQDSFGPTSLRRAATDEMLGILPLLQRLPRRLDRITAAIERNQFSANIRLFADPRDTRLVSRLVSRVVLAFMGIGIAIASVLLLGLSGGPRITSTLSLFQLFGYSGLFCSVILLLRVVVAIARERVG